MFATNVAKAISSNIVLPDNVGGSSTSPHEYERVLSSLALEVDITKEQLEKFQIFDSELKSIG